MKRRRKLPMPFVLSLGVGASLVAIGLLLLIDPRVGERAFGKDPGWESDRAFHRATGIRQAYIGALIILLGLLRERRVLGALLLTAPVVPAAKFLLALRAPGGSFGKALRHAASVPLVVALGLHLLRR
jgi:Domain of unknown function (DUF4267)